MSETLIPKIIDKLTQGKNQVDRFFFHSVTFKVGLARILLGATLFYMYLIRTVNLDFYNESGIIPRSESLDLFNEISRPIFSWNFWPDQAVVWIHGLLLILLFLFTLGLLGRILTALLFVILMGFIHRNYAVLFGADVIGALSVFYYIFQRPSAQLSIAGLWKKQINSILPREIDEMLQSAGYRLLQIQIIIIYTYTGFEKLRGSSWWNGTALWSVMINPQMMIVNFSFMKHFPMLVGIMTFSAMIFEVYFGAAMLNPKFRKIWLAMGVVFHLLIGVFMDLVPFSLVMISSYFLFLTEEELLQLKKYVPFLRQNPDSKWNTWNQSP